MQDVLEEAGVSTNQYKNPETKQFIDQFVQDYTSKQDSSIGYPSTTNYNGYAQQPSANRYNNQKPNGPPPLPQTQPSYTYNNPANYSMQQQQQFNARNSLDNSMNHHNLSSMSNHVNSQQQSNYVTKPAPPIPSYKSTAPKPPPLPTNLTNNNSNASSNNRTAAPSQPLNRGDIPPPPPLPPPMPPSSSQPQQSTTITTNNSSAPKPPPLPQPSNDPPDTRSALLDQIRQGRKLNKVEKTTEPNNSNNQASGDTRDALLDQIRQGKKLKSVNINAEKPAPALNTSGLAGALARALQERSRVLQQTDESSSDSSDIEDEEWSD